MALTTLANVKAWLGSSYNGSDDAVLGSLIDAVSVAINEYLNRTIESTVLNEYYNGSYQKGIRLRNWPVTAMTSVFINGASIQILAPNDYSSNGVRWSPEHYLIANGVEFTKGWMNVIVNYTAGYAPDAIPDDIVQAANEMVALRYKNSRGDRLGVSSKGLAGETITFSQKDMPDSTKSVLKQYMSVVPS